MQQVPLNSNKNNYADCSSDCNPRPPKDLLLSILEPLRAHPLSPAAAVLLQWKWMMHASSSAVARSIERVQSLGTVAESSASSSGAVVEPVSGVFDLKCLEVWIAVGTLG